MRLTRASSYAIHALVFMANEKDNRPVASHLIARARGIPERFLLKVLKPLVSAGVLHSIKGPNGGYGLAKTPKAISVLEIVEAIDGPMRGSTTVSASNTDPGLNRRLEQISKRVTEQIRQQLQKVHLSDLVGKG